MNQIFSILFKIVLVFLGVGFFLIMLFIAAVTLVLFGLRQLWYKLIGKQPQPMSGFHFNPIDGFTYFYSRSTKAGGRYASPEPTHLR